MAQTSRQANVIGKYRPEFLTGKQKAADHFYRLFQAEMSTLAADVQAGKESLMALSEAEF
jgi:hypothetical protein